ncbi:hypothetical protein [Mycolicibacterium houstonense]|uniref:hypothetical protein n=1 Tax=Mycolicibacterium houstonense TaxID=146021 RepID=UPI003F9DB3A0
MVDPENKPKPWSQIFLGSLAIVVLVGGFVGALKGLPELLASLLFIAGVLLAVLAAFWSRIQGTVEFTKDGAKIPIGAARRAEEQAQRGEFVAAEKVPAAVEAVEDAVSQFGTPTVSQLRPHGSEERSPAPRQEEPDSRAAEEPSRISRGRNVQLVDDAVVTMATLTDHERSQVQAEIARMSHPDFREEADARGIRVRERGRSYRVHRVPNTDLRLWYRPLNEDQPETLVVMVISKHQGGN